MLYRLRALIRNLLFRKQLEARLDDEIESAVEILAAEYVRDGIDPKDARRRAQIELGGREQVREYVRQGRSGAMIEEVVRDLWVTTRSLRRSPAFSLVTLLVIAVTIAGTSTVFTLVDSVLLEPLPFPNSRRLVVVTQRNSDEGELPGRGFRSAVSWPDFLDIRSESRSFEALAGFRSTIRELDPFGPERYIVSLRATSASLFEVIPTVPHLGRLLTPGDELPGSSPVAVVSFDFWQERLGGREDVIGDTLALPDPIGDRQFALTIVGVLPAAYSVPLATEVPGADSGSVWTTPDLFGEGGRQMRSTTVLGLMRSDSSLDEVTTELSALSRALAATYPETNDSVTAHAASLLDFVVGDTERLLWMWFGAVACVLLIGVANLLSLQIARNARRQQELHVRSALGAGRARLVFHMLVETLTLSTLGGALGLALAASAFPVLTARLPAGTPRFEAITPDVSVVVFAAAVATLVGLVVGLIPALRMSRANLPVPIGATRFMTAGFQRMFLQRSLITVATALALVLLVGAGLLTHSLWRLFAQDLGIDEANLWTVEVELPDDYAGGAMGLAGDDDLRRSFWTSLLRRVEGLPDVVAASLTSIPPLGGGDTVVRITPAESNSPESAIMASWRPVGPAFFETVGTPLLEGRSINDADRPETEPVAVLNEAAASRLWPGEPAVGRRLAHTGGLITIVGVIPDFRHARLRGDVSPQIYTAYFQALRFGLRANETLVLRTRPDPGGPLRQISSLIEELEPRAVATEATIGTARWRQTENERSQALVLLAFASTATFLATLGIFGVVAYHVSERRREIGIRVALGASRGSILALMIRQVLWPVGLGLAVGTLSALALTRLLETFLFEIHPTDPLAFAAAAVGMSLVALLASYLPARRATQVDPMSELKYE